MVIAGTGSMAFGRNSAGEVARAGGWGYAFGDEGSAFDIARQAMRVALREEEGWGPRTALREALLLETGARDMNDLLHRFYRGELPRARVAALAEVVEATALGGDAVAQELLGAAAQSLALIASAVRRKLVEGEAAPVVDVRYCGGVFRCRGIQARFKLFARDGRAHAWHGAAGLRGRGGALLEAFRIAGAACTLKGAPEAEGWSGL